MAHVSRIRKPKFTLRDVDAEIVKHNLARLEIAKQTSWQRQMKVNEMAKNDNNFKDMKLVAVWDMKDWLWNQQQYGDEEINSPEFIRYAQKANGQTEITSRI